MSDWKPKRFWKESEVVELDNGYTVELDGRRVKTPAKDALVLPTREMAQAVAAEWDAQDKEVDLVKEPTPDRAGHEADHVRHDPDDESDHADFHRQPVGGVGQVVDAHGEHHEIAETHEHPGDERETEKRVRLSEAQGAQRMRAARDMERLGGNATDAEAAEKEGSAERDQQFPEATDVRVQCLAGQFTEQGRRRNTDHDRLGKSPPALLARIVVLIDLRHQRDR